MYYWIQAREGQEERPEYKDGFLQCTLSGKRAIYTNRHEAKKKARLFNGAIVPATENLSGAAELQELCFIENIRENLKDLTNNMPTGCKPHNRLIELAITVEAYSERITPEVWHNKAYAEAKRIKTLSAFNIEGKAGKRKLNQHATAYYFDDGSLLIISDTSRRIDVYNTKGNAQAAFAMFGG
jgi:hypothetical protein